LDNHSFTSLGDYLAALDALLSGAGNHIRILDQDLKDQGWDSPGRPALLRDFLLGDRERRVQILLRDSAYLVGRCPHVMYLLRDYGHQLEIRIADEDTRFEDSFVLGDETLLLYRYDLQRWDGRFANDDRQGVIQLTERFDTAWERLTGGLAYTPLGL
jgi:hypothetical protein